MRYVCLVVKLSRLESQFVEPGPNLCGAGIKTFEVEGLLAAQELLGLMQFDAVVILGSVLFNREKEVLSSLRVFRAPMIVSAPSRSESQTVRLLEAGAAVVLDADASSRLAGLQVLKAIEANRGTDVVPHAALVVGPLRLDPFAFSGHVNGQPLALTTRQFNVLFTLAARPGKIVPRGELERLLGLIEGRSGRSVDMQICRLRRCLRDAGDSTISIRTVYGTGYCLTGSAHDSVHATQRGEPALQE